MISADTSSSSLQPRPSRVKGLPAALPLLAAAFAAGLRPPPAVTVSQWAESTRVVAAESGSPFPGKWSNELTPYLPEVMDCLSLSHPARDVTFKKAAQIAGSEAGLNMIGTVIDKTPAPILAVLPSLDEAKRYVKLKLQPTIDETPALKAKVREQKSRDEDGSTTSLKKFRGGFLQVTGANSSKGLQMISVRVLLLEEISEFPFDVDNRGDPVELAEKRLLAWSGREKIFRNSTPGIKGMCRVSAKYEASDQRRYYVPCPHCGDSQVLEWKQLKFRARDAERVDPADVFYQCAANGCVIEHHHKKAMLARGRWIAHFPNEGRQPGFHINQLYSPFVSWADTVRAFLAAKDDPAKLKVFVQQVLGEEWEAKGEAPDSLKLFARREPYKLGFLPPGALIVTMGVDVQADRLEYGAWAWGVGKTSWIVDRGVIEGDTTLPATWRHLDQIIERRYADALGNAWPIDRIAVDAGYNTQAVYAWCRGKPRVLAVKGMPGHLHPALGTPTAQDLDWKGQRSRRGIRLWPVGTWSLKAEFYANLRKTMAGPDADGGFPIGYVHLSEDLDEVYLKQLTAESLVTRERRGYALQEWVKSADARNEALDIRVYAASAAAHLGIDRFTPARWTDLAAAHGAPRETLQRDLEALWNAPAKRTPQAEQTSAAPQSFGSEHTHPTPHSPTLLGVRADRWWRR